MNFYRIIGHGVEGRPVNFRMNLGRVAELSSIWCIRAVCEPGTVPFVDVKIPCREGIDLTSSYKLCLCRTARPTKLLLVFVCIYYCMCSSNSEHRWVVYFIIPQGAHVSCLSSCCKPEDIKGGACFLLCLSFSFGRWPWFWIPIWSAAAPSVSSFPPLHSPSSCVEVFFHLPAFCCWWGDVWCYAGLHHVACMQKWHCTSVFPGCLSSSGALMVV